MTDRRRNKPRRSGNAPIGEARTLPAGTKLYRRGETPHGGGPRTEYTAEHDIVVSADQCDGETVEIGDWIYDVLDGWDEP